jgi:hypothetical protein
MIIRVLLAAAIAAPHVGCPSRLRPAAAETGSDAAELSDLHFQRIGLRTSGARPLACNHDPCQPL